MKTGLEKLQTYIECAIEVYSKASENEVSNYYKSKVEVLENVLEAAKMIKNNEPIGN